jgi:hypothetical protein
MGERSMRCSVKAFAVAVLGFLSSGCSQTCTDMGFRSFEKADRIVVKQMSKIVLKTITDSSDISQIARFAESHGNGWSVPFGGTPVGSITLEFYADGHFLGDLGIGKRFLEAQGCGYFFSRQVGADDVSEISRLVGISETFIK